MRLPLLIFLAVLILILTPFIPWERVEKYFNWKVFAQRIKTFLQPGLEFFNRGFSRMKDGWNAINAWLVSNVGLNLNAIFSDLTQWIVRGIVGIRNFLISLFRHAVTQ